MKWILACVLLLVLPGCAEIPIINNDDALLDVAVMGHELVDKRCVGDVETWGPCHKLTVEVTNRADSTYDELAENWEVVFTNGQAKMVTDVSDKSDLAPGASKRMVLSVPGEEDMVPAEVVVYLLNFDEVEELARVPVPAHLVDVRSSPSARDYLNASSTFLGLLPGFAGYYPYEGPSFNCGSRMDYSWKNCFVVGLELHHQGAETWHLGYSDDTRVYGSDGKLYPAKGWKGSTSYRLEPGMAAVMDFKVWLPEDVVPVSFFLKQDNGDEHISGTASVTDFNLSLGDEGEFAEVERVACDASPGCIAFFFDMHAHEDRMPVKAENFYVKDANGARTKATVIDAPGDWFSLPGVMRVYAEFADASGDPIRLGYHDEEDLFSHVFE